MIERVLIVDDEEDVRAILQLGLEAVTDWTVLTAASGEEALAIAAHHPLDVILLDWIMPAMDGRTTLQHLKANLLTQSIPVILMTAEFQSSTQENFVGLDVAAIFAKPFRPLQLAAQITDVLGKS